ncbi:MAG: hypothetical protein ABMA25_08300, partial [Ilumatobacteraceae bacterium]
ASPAATASPSPADSSVAAPTDATTAAPTPDGDFDICASVPSLDVINAQLDEPVTGLQDLERGPGEDVCEANGDGVANVQFQVLTPSDRASLEPIAAELGYPLADVNDPALPGAVTYAGAVTVFVGDTGYTVQAITMDTITDPTSPLAVQRSAALLAAWLQNMGVAL